MAQYTKLIRFSIHAKTHRSDFPGYVTGSPSKGGQIRTPTGQGENSHVQFGRISRQDAPISPVPGCSGAILRPGFLANPDIGGIPGLKSLPSPDLNHTQNSIFHRVWPRAHPSRISSV